MGDCEHCKGYDFEQEKDPKFISFVAHEKDMASLRDHWFEGLSTKELADKYKKSETAIKEVFRAGDKILLRAARMSEPK